MIGAYLHSLYNNCKALAKTSAHNPEAVKNHFNDEISRFIAVNALTSEANLVQHLIKTPYGALLHLLESSAYVKLFYLVNSLSEYASGNSNRDELGRYTFESSVQQQTGITNNLVLKLMKATVQENAVLQANYKPVHHPGYFFLSHDIDSLYGSMLQDGLWALKHKRFDVMLKLFANVLAAKPHWFNIDLIMDLESEYDFKSTFYWLVNKGKIDQRQTNSDYEITSGKLKQTVARVKAKGFENGLHKSISSETFATELAKLPGNVVGNRYHYLKYQLPAAYNAIENAGLELDASLGFAEHYGFRNNYGYPFSPYNIETGLPYSFMEVPLTVMDGTLQRYMKLPVNKTAETAIAFFENNKQDCLLSVLWHNTFFTDYKYKGYKDEYIKILRYFYEEKFININQSEIIASFSWKR